MHNNMRMYDRSCNANVLKSAKLKLDHVATHSTLGFTSVRGPV